MQAQQTHMVRYGKISRAFWLTMQHDYETPEGNVENLGPVVQS